MGSMPEIEEKFLEKILSLGKFMEKIVKIREMKNSIRNSLKGLTEQELKLTELMAAI